MTIAGPRVIEAMGEDYKLLQSFSIKNRYQMPFVAILAQAGWSIFLVLVSSFNEIIQYISISLSFFSMLTVLGIFFLRKNALPGEHFKTPLYPITPLVFILCTLWMMYYVAMEDYKIMIYSAATLIPGFLLYYASIKHQR
jgi:APA family basic amino acid/polyamine antiporter